MNVNRQQLHELIDIVDSKELNIVYHLLTKFIPEDLPTPEEIVAIKKGREEIARGEFVRHEDINWD